MQKSEKLCHSKILKKWTKIVGIQIILKKCKNSKTKLHATYCFVHTFFCEINSYHYILIRSSDHIEKIYYIKIIHEKIILSKVWFIISK